MNITYFHVTDRYYTLVDGWLLLWQPWVSISSWQQWAFMQQQIPY